MKLSLLSIYFEEIENTSSRLEMTRILAKLFSEIEKEEIEKVLYLLQGKVAPLYEKADFGMGDRMVISGIIRALQIERKLFIAKYKKIGDLGQTTEYFKKSITPMYKKDLSVSDAFEILEKIAKTHGSGSQNIKLSLLGQLIEQVDPLSSRYIVRIPVNRLRLGFSDMTMLDSLSWMIKGDKSLRKSIEKAYHVRPDLGLIGKMIKTKGVKSLSTIKPLVFTPIIMMKAERLSCAKEILSKAPNSLIESKYDGFRLQIHLRAINGKDTKIKLFSRGLEDVTFMYPDIVAGVKREVKAREAIFEGEAIGFDIQTGSFLPFQETVQRKRKYDIEEKALEIPLKLFAFEMLYYNGTNLLNTAFKKRRKTLEKTINTTGDIYKDTILLAPEQKICDRNNINLAFEDAVSKGLEGIMIKKTDGIYQPGARGWNWIKYKKSYSSKVTDTLDCLVMGYDFGKGRRAAFGIGAILVGIYDKKADLFKTIAKIGTGLTDDQWKNVKERLDKIKKDKKPAIYDVDKQMKVDIWVNLGLVLEIRADEITRSPVHTAGRILRPTRTNRALEIEEAGFALRFPRLEKIRDDKQPTDTTTLSEIKKLYSKAH